MADGNDDEKRKREAAAEADQGSPDDVIAGPDAPAVGGDPQIMTMTGMPQPAAAAAPGGDMFRRGMQGPPGQEQGHHMGFGGGLGGGFLQQLWARIQAAQQARQQQHQGHGMQPPWAQGPMGQQMQQQHPGWFPQAAPAGQTPANIVMGDHTGEPGPGAAMPPTAAAAAQQQAQAAAPAPAAAATQAPAQRPQAPSPERRAPMGVMQQAPQQGTRMPMFGGNASASIQDEIKRRQGLGGGMGGGGNRRMF